MVVRAPRESLQLMFLLREEDQAVSGRWLSITRAQLRPPSDSWTEDLMSGLLSVLIIAGWSTREPHQQDQVERHLPSIFKAVQDLRKALGEDVTSMVMNGHHRSWRDFQLYEHGRWVRGCQSAAWDWEQDSGETAGLGLR